MIKQYADVIRWVANESMNMPNPDREPGKFIQWSEDICGLIGEIYDVDFEAVVADLQEELGLIED